MPPGWHAQFDQNSQRWYYVEQATGRTQWDPPAHAPPPQGPYAPPPPGAPGQPGQHPDERGLFGNTQPSHDAHGYGGSQDPYAHSETKEKDKEGKDKGEKKDNDKKDKKKDKGHSTAMLAAAGVGGVAAGALIGHELSMSIFLGSIQFMPLTESSGRLLG